MQAGNFGNSSSVALLLTLFPTFALAIQAVIVSRSELSLVDRSIIAKHKSPKGFGDKWVELKSPK